MMKKPSAYQIGDIVYLTDDALMGGYEDIGKAPLKIVDVSFSKEDHPGYDEGVGLPLYEVVHAETGYSVGASLYEYELER